MNLHTIKVDLTKQEKAVWALEHINPGQYRWTFNTDGTVTWFHLTSRNEGILDIDYFEAEYEAYKRGAR